MKLNDLARVAQLLRDEARTLTLDSSDSEPCGWKPETLIAKKEGNDGQWMCLFGLPDQGLPFAKLFSIPSLLDLILLNSQPQELSLPWKGLKRKSYTRMWTRTNYVWIFYFKNSLLSFSLAKQMGLSVALRNVYTEKEMSRITQLLQETLVAEWNSHRMFSW